MSSEQDVITTNATHSNCEAIQVTWLQLDTTGFYLAPTLLYNWSDFIQILGKWHSTQVHRNQVS